MGVNESMQGALVYVISAIYDMCACVHVCVKDLFIFRSVFIPLVLQFTPHHPATPVSYIHFILLAE